MFLRHFGTISQHLSAHSISFLVISVYFSSLFSILLHFISYFSALSAESFTDCIVMSWIKVVTQPSI